MLGEQREIARILRAVDRKIEAEEARRGALEGLFRSLLHQLMTAKRRLPAEFAAQFEQGTEPTS
jgi:type I restriction enzyme S subunit